MGLPNRINRPPGHCLPGGRPGFNMVKVGDKQFAWHDGLTVAGLLELLGDEYDYPAVKLGQEIISKAKFAQTPVPDGAQLHLIPLIAGG